MEKTTLTFAYSNAIMQVEKVPMHLALQELDKQGITTKETFNQSGNDAVQEVASGQADFGTSNASTVFAAIKKGVPLKVIMGSYKPFYLLVAPVSVADPSGLDGKTLGIQSAVSSTTLYGDLALAKYPNVKPKVEVVAGSANRVQAMIAGKMDASVLQPSDWLTLQQKAPGKFHVIYDVAQENPDIVDSVIFANTKTLDSSPNYTKALVAALQHEYSTIYDDPAQLASDIQTLVSDTTAANAKSLADSLVQDKIWVANGDLAAIPATLKAMINSGLFKAADLPAAADISTDQFLTTTEGQ